MQREKVPIFQSLETLQKDIERVLKPYGILAGKPYRRGYYLGTGVFNTSELTSRLLHEDTKYPLRMLGTKSMMISNCNAGFWGLRVIFE